MLGVLCRSVYQTVVVRVKFMYLGKVIGTCVATQKITGLDGLRLLVVQPMTPDLDNYESAREHMKTVYKDYKEERDLGMTAGPFYTVAQLVTADAPPTHRLGRGPPRAGKWHRRVEVGGLPLHARRDHRIPRHPPRGHASGQSAALRAMGAPRHGAVHSAGIARCACTGTYE